jgi:hypothetical protein
VSLEFTSEVEEVEEEEVVVYMTTAAAQRFWKMDGNVA